jgi:hypothetical protein
MSLSIVEMSIFIYLQIKLSRVLYFVLKQSFVLCRYRYQVLLFRKDTYTQTNIGDYRDILVRYLL